ncbi:adenylate kinase subfamily protein [Kipferlia bialata]|uniref:Adenylate kinase subfamily protein n=1 Tax=Kipferlia bialata TaxID=797122 RepID=A0A9K3D567_9EUKA|nr:adenylate kinase subfamily protein [Kipferlia bialata]|eukprot:g10425.t1
MSSATDNTAPNEETIALFKDALEATIVNKPENPVEFLKDFMQGSSGAPRVILTGLPGAGKGTISPILVKEFGMVHVAPGDILRAAKRDGTPLGLEAAKYMSAGNLVPDELIVAMILQRLAEDDVVQNGFILDGFPRSVPQAHALLDAGVIPTHFILLEITEDEVRMRLSGRRLDPTTGSVYHVEYNPPPADIAERIIQRSDDVIEAINHRISVYRMTTAPVVDVFASCCVRINASQGSDDAARDCIAAIRKGRVHDSASHTLPEEGVIEVEGELGVTVTEVE